MESACNIIDKAATEQHRIQENVLVIAISIFRMQIVTVPRKRQIGIFFLQIFTNVDGDLSDLLSGGLRVVGLPVAVLVLSPNRVQLGVAGDAELRNDIGGGLCLSGGN